MASLVHLNCRVRHSVPEVVPEAVQHECRHHQTRTQTWEAGPHHKPQPSARYQGSLSGARPVSPGQNQFHHLPRNIIASGPRNHLNSLERDQWCKSGHPIPTLKLLHVPDQPTTEALSQEAWSGRPWTLLPIPPCPLSARDKDKDQLLPEPWLPLGSLASCV